MTLRPPSRGFGGALPPRPPEALTSSPCLLFFLRAPLPGRVKTRLAREVGDATAVALYTACVEDMLEALDATGLPLALLVDAGTDAPASRAGTGMDAPAQLPLADVVEGAPASPTTATPGGNIEAVRNWLGAQRLCVPQSPGDLGARLDAAFRWAFEQGYPAAVALGSDIPQIDQAVVTEAARMLQEHKTILGPSPDGGYWCIGFARESYRPEVFMDMPWSTPELFSRTVKALAGQPFELLPSLADMDTLKDVRGLLRSGQDGTARRVLAALRTFKGAPHCVRNGLPRPFRPGIRNPP